MHKYKSCSWFKPTTVITTSVIILTLAEQIPSQAKENPVLYLAQTPELSPGTNLNNLPNTPLPDSQREPSIKPLPPDKDLLEPLPNPSLPEQTPKSEIEFTVKQFKLEGNTVLATAEIDAIFAEYLNRSLTFSDLLELETRLTKLYTRKGYINSGVIIPEQDVKQGLVSLQAVEGSLEEIEIDVDGRLRESYIRSRIARGAKSPLNIEELQEALYLLQLNPLVENLKAELSVGQSRDRWKLNVDLNQGNEFDSVLLVNNNRTPSVGSFQRGLELNHNNVLGYADRFSFGLRNTDGSNDFNTSYNIPVNSKDGTVGLGYRWVDSDIIGDFAEFDLESQTDELALTFRQPIILRADNESTQELALGLEFSRQTNEVTIGGEPFPLLSPGADANGETKISALRFFQDWTKRTRKDVFAARSQFSAGVDIFNATVNEGLPDSKFVAWRGQLQWLRQLKSAEDINLLLRSDIQLSSDDLVPLERFSLGGVEGGRGYRQDALLGDGGLFASAEVRIPIYRWSNSQNNQKHKLSAIPFLDLGTTWSNSDEQEGEDTLASLGVGLKLDLVDTLSARIDYGIPLIEVKDSDDTLQEKGLYFSLEYFPF
jgi:hemolysin activation/secretion protein